MKKSNIAFALVIVVLGAYFAMDANFGQSLFQSFFSKDIKILNEMSLSFMEDLKFKDFENASIYHHPEDREKVDIPTLIERMFKIKPEFLDVMEYNILDANLDSTKKRGRVKLTAKVHLLNSDKIKNPEIILYFYNRKEKWYMELESSLK